MVDLSLHSYTAILPVLCFTAHVVYSEAAILPVISYAAPLINVPYHP